MLEKFTAEHWNDAQGNPSGGVTQGVGFTISWQNGPLGRGADRRNPNGAFVETIIGAAIDRLNYYQQSKFHCEENQKAIEACYHALAALNLRTSRRDRAGIEGTHAEEPQGAFCTGPLSSDEVTRLRQQKIALQREVESLRQQLAAQNATPEDLPNGHWKNNLINPPPMPDAPCLLCGCDFGYSGAGPQLCIDCIAKQPAAEEPAPAAAGGDDGA